VGKTMCSTSQIRTWRHRVRLDVRYFFFKISFFFKMVSAAPGNVRGQGVFGAFLPQRRVSWKVSAAPGNVCGQGVFGAFLPQRRVSWKVSAAPGNVHGRGVIGALLPHKMVSAAPSPGNVREEGVIAAFLPQRPKEGIMDGIGKSWEPT
jgi:hypothetical protein